MKIRFFMVFGLISVWIIFLLLSVGINTLKLKGAETAIIFSLGYIFKSIHIAFTNEWDKLDKEPDK